jgi:hypothetical protein
MMEERGCSASSLAKKAGTNAACSASENGKPSQTCVRKQQPPRSVRAHFSQGARILAAIRARILTTGPAAGYLGTALERVHRATEAGDHQPGGDCHSATVDVGRLRSLVRREEAAGIVIACANGD